MLTFLRFARTVKTPSRSIAVCALILGANASCTVHTLARDPAPKLAPGAHAPPSPALPGAATSSTPPLTTEASAVSEPMIAALPEFDLSLEVPYASGSLPGADGAKPVADEELMRWNVGSGADANASSNSVSFHPGTRVIVDTRLAKRSATAAKSRLGRGAYLDRVQAQARSHGYWPFRRCFERAQREQKMAGGETRILFTIGTRGRVRKARLLDAELGARNAAECLVREVLKLEFSPRPAQALSILATIAIYPGDTELVELTEPTSAPATAPESSGLFDPIAVRKLLAEKLPELRPCFAAARSTEPGLWGRLALAIVLEVDGSVHRVTEIESHFPHPGTVRCVEALLSSVRFPSVNGKPFSFVVALRLGANPAARNSAPPNSAAPNSESTPSSAQPLPDEH